MSGHGHMPHVSHGGDEQLGGFRLEIVIAVLLGLAAIVGALAIYLGHVAEGHAVKHYNEAVRKSNDSAFFYNQGNQKLIRDQALFQEYAKGAYEGTKTNDYTFPAYIQTTLMDEQLKKMVDWWTTGTNTKKYSSPFVEEDPYFKKEDYDEGAKLDEESTHLFEDGKKQEDKSNRYTLVEVLIASALFLYGIAGVTRRLQIKLGFLGVGFVLFALSLVQLSLVRWT